MLFTSFEFIIFFIIVYILYRKLDHKKQNLMLLISSYFFYGSWDWRFLSLILSSTVIDYFCGLKIYNATQENYRKVFLFISLFFNLSFLSIFKYFNFFSTNFQSLLALFGLHSSILTLNIILPVGISFYTFQTLSYSIDIYRKKLRPERNFLDFALFVSFFPQLVAGPIERASRLLPQITTPRKITRKNIEEGLFYVFWGYFLKVVLADNMAFISNQVFSKTGIIPGGEALFGVYAFAFQIFGDFAGYSFIAIGISKLMGFHLMTNFLFPYFVKTPSEFWQNWHISLSTWLRDYLYIPLGGNKKGKLLTYRNLFLTMLLGGLWHGAGWTFIIWGIYHGCILIIFRLLGASNTPKNTIEKFNTYSFLKIFLMFQLTCIGWLIFRAESMSQITDLLYSIFFNFSLFTEKVPYYAFSILFYSWLVLVVQFIQMKHNNLLLFGVLSKKSYIAINLIMFYLIVLWGEFGGQQFIYFQF